MENNYWDAAETAQEFSSEVWGKVYLDVTPWFFAGGGAKPVPYDPQNPEHAKKQPSIQVDMKMQVLPQMNLKFEVKRAEYTFSKDYTKIMLPSIKALNLTPDGKGILKALNEKWVKIDRVEGFTQNTRNPELGNFKTWKFLKVFASEEECLKDYEATYNVDGKPWPEEHKPADIAVNPAKETALTIARVFVDEACRNFKGNKDSVIGFLEGKFAQNPDVGKYVKPDSPEIIEMIDNWTPFGK